MDAFCANLDKATGRGCKQRHKEAVVMHHSEGGVLLCRVGDLHAMERRACVDADVEEGRVRVAEFVVHRYFVGGHHLKQTAGCNKTGMYINYR